VKLASVHKEDKIKARIAVIALFFIIAIAAVFSEKLREGYEIASTRIFPDGARAFAYGERHFTADDPKAYDVDLAEYFFNRAQMLDPNLPYVNHELARIDFLKGVYGAALAHIAVQIEQEGDKMPNSYYVKGLIEGYMGQYDASARDYEHFLRFDPYNWAGLNDYAWVLLKAGRDKDAFFATSKGLEKFPDNPWLLNSNAIALYEMGYLKDAKLQAQHALDEGKSISLADWLHAYPGNDPRIAKDGVEAFKRAMEENMHSIISSTSTHALQ